MLSGGLKLGVWIAVAVLGNPELAVLFVLTTGLDPKARRDTWDLIEGVRDRGVTIVLVTHFMDEAQRLCDRLALIDAGRIVALDTPDGLIKRAAGEQRVRFRPSEPFDHGFLATVPEVGEVTTSRGEVVVSGTGNLVTAVVLALNERKVVPNDLRVEQANLEDAFVALTGSTFDAEPSHR